MYSILRLKKNMLLSVQKQGNTRETADPEIQPRGVTTADSAAPSAPRTAQEGGALGTAPRTARGSRFSTWDSSGLPVQHPGQLKSSRFSTPDSSGGSPVQHPGQLRGSRFSTPGSSKVQHRGQLRTPVSVPRTAPGHPGSEPLTAQGPRMASCLEAFSSNILFK